MSRILYKVRTHVCGHNHLPDIVTRLEGCGDCSEDTVEYLGDQVGVEAAGITVPNLSGV